VRLVIKIFVTKVKILLYEKKNFLNLAEKIGVYSPEI
tara:strand:- start:680 stop:790 length:111 start_codon:yes stop_codon:yes gene_type:complete